MLLALVEARGATQSLVTIKSSLISIIVHVQSVMGNTHIAG
jgi:hypothetical protein